MNDDRVQFLAWETQPDEPSNPLAGQDTSVVSKDVDEWGNEWSSVYHDVAQDLEFLWQVAKG